MSTDKPRDEDVLSGNTSFVDGALESRAFFNQLAEEAVPAPITPEEHSREELQQTLTSDPIEAARAAVKEAYAVQEIPPVPLTGEVYTRRIIDNG